MFCKKKKLTEKIKCHGSFLKTGGVSRMVDSADKGLAVVLVGESVLKDRGGLVATVPIRFGFISLFSLA